MLGSHLAGHERGQVHHSLGVTPLVVVPEHDLHHVATHDHRECSINRVGVVRLHEVAGDQRLLLEIDDALHGALGSLLQGGIHVLRSALVCSLHNEIDDGDVGSWHSQGDAVELALELREDQSHRLRGASGGRNDVHGSSTGSSEILVPSVEDHLVASVGMRGGHDAILDTERLVQDLADGGHAVGGAGGVGDNIVLLTVVVAFVDAHDESGAVLARGCDHNLLGARLHVLGSAIHVVEGTCGLDDNVNVQGSPRHLRRVSSSHDLDLFAIHDQGVVGVGHIRFQGSQNGVVLQKMRRCLRGHGADVDGDNIKRLVVSLQPASEHVSSDSSEAIDGSPDVASSLHCDGTPSLCCATRGSLLLLLRCAGASSDSDRLADESSGRWLLLPAEARGLQVGLASVSELLLPARVDLIGIVLEGQESTLQFLVSLRILDHTLAERHVSVLAVLPILPGLLRLAAGDGTRLRTVLVAEGTSTSSQDDVGVPQVVEESWEPQSVHAARNDGSGLLHAFPLLMVVRAICGVLLQHVGDVLVAQLALHLAEGHGADVDPAGSQDTGHLRVHEGSVATLALRAGHSTVAGPVVVQELPGEVASGHCHSSATCHVAIHEEGNILCQRSELRQNVLAASDHFVGIVCGNVGAEDFLLSSLLDACLHGLHNLRNALLHLAECLVALRLVVLDEVATLPERVAGLAEGLGLQAQFGLDDGADDQAAVLLLTAQEFPQVFDVG
mmetsp:Transcript_78150/g.171343  ORF Transcript_78150/g.171343 Transcript_78150/m.171343 type:complete len:728 (+) Transcript_78150:314-2497(+)